MATSIGKNPEDSKKNNGGVNVLKPEDIVPGDPSTTLWRWCVRNGWAFVADIGGGEPYVDTRCAAAYVSPSASYKTAQNTILLGVTRYPGGLVKISEVMQVRSNPLPN